MLDTEDRIRLLEYANRVLCGEMPKGPLVAVVHAAQDEDGRGIRFAVIDPTGDLEHEAQVLRQVVRVAGEVFGVE